MISILKGTKMRTCDSLSGRKRVRADKMDNNQDAYASIVAVS